MTRYCRHCGKIFENTTNKKFCSDECRRLDYNRKQREFYHNFVSKKKIKHCKVCGKAFQGRNHTYCSIECRDKGKRIAKEERLRKQADQVKSVILNNPNCEYGNVDCDYCLEFSKCIQLMKFPGASEQDRERI